MKLSGMTRNKGSRLAAGCGDSSGGWGSWDSNSLMDDAYAASCEAVKLDFKAAKALYLRAKSRLRRSPVTKEDCKASIKDLRKSLELDEDNVDILDEL